MTYLVVLLLGLFIGSRLEAIGWRRAGRFPTIQKCSRGKLYWVVGPDAHNDLKREVAHSIYKQAPESKVVTLSLRKRQ